MSGEAVGLRIRVQGIVQGVGFRPFVYAQALKNRLSGWVRNTSSGVEIEVSGEPQDVQSFVDALQSQPPPLARIDRLESQPIAPNGAVSFKIIASQAEAGEFIPVSPDVAICPDCAHELFDPQDRRYRYPFLNCTNCGPRFTIIRDIPYDRPQTTMAGFEMCPDCLAEYHDPANRRFHAQPVACPACGPALWLAAGEKRLFEGEDALQTARRWLQEGKILAVKGLGGFHLACDAANPQAVAALRGRKKRSDKPFALMSFDLAGVEAHCHLNPAERELLLSRQKPIVLLEKKTGSTIASQVAPQQPTLGFMLAYTPLHLLLMQPAPGFPQALVMTSGNLSEEPIAYADEDALKRLAPLADGFLMHNRPIHMRVDDPVVRAVGGKAYPIRRGRGYAPDPLPFPLDSPPLLAAGAELKNAFCFTRQRYAFLSHHIGDLENYETLRSYEEAIEHYERLFRLQPLALACDLHPDYLATRYAHQRAGEQGLQLIEVQHHHAHLAACLADNGWQSDEAVIGLTFDGTGMGSDGAIWGGEILLGNYRSFRRLYHLAYTPLPGGDLAVKKPARMALAHLWQAGIDWQPGLPPVEALCYEERLALRIQLERSLNSLPTSSMGRLFDAASALLGIRQEASYEGQAAIELEAAADRQESGWYEFEIGEDTFDPAGLWRAMLAEQQTGAPPAALAARFHNSVARLCLQLCQRIRQDAGSETVALSGGVWQNRLLLEKTIALLEGDGLRVLIHRQAPANDGGLALGQAAVAASLIRAE